MFFFDTLGASEQSAKTVLDKVTTMGTIEAEVGVEDNQQQEERNALVRELISGQK